MTGEDYRLARRMWHQLELIHAAFWYAPEVFEEAAGLGYDVPTRWPSYFAWRLAPLGATGLAAGGLGLLQLQPGHGGRPRARHVGGGATAAVLAARERAVDRMYRALLGELIGDPLRINERGTSP